MAHAVLDWLGTMRLIGFYKYIYAYVCTYYMYITCIYESVQYYFVNVHSSLQYSRNSARARAVCGTRRNNNCATATRGLLLYYILSYIMIYILLLFLLLLKLLLLLRICTRKYITVAVEKKYKSLPPNECSTYYGTRAFCYRLRVLK